MTHEKYVVIQKVSEKKALVTNYKLPSMELWYSQTCNINELSTWLLTDATFKTNITFYGKGLIFGYDPDAEKKWYLEELKITYKGENEIIVETLKVTSYKYFYNALMEYTEYQALNCTSINEKYFTTMEEIEELRYKYTKIPKNYYTLKDHKPMLWYEKNA